MAGRGVGDAELVGSASAALEAEAAVDSEELAGDEVWAGGEKDCGGGHVFGGAVALHGRFVCEMLVGWADFTLNDHAGGDAVDTDFRGPCLGHGLGEHVEGGLRGTVVGVGGPGVGSAEGAEIEDAALGGAEVREAGAGHEEGSAGVGGEHGVPLGGGDVFEGERGEDAGVVDEEVETSEGFGRG